jgi:RNA polymerase sigma factor (sigma-70 family)
MATDARRAVEAVWRIESARLIAGLARMVRDVGLAEELAQDALVSALEQWPGTGIPRNPGAWLMTAAKNRAVDQIRRRQNYQRKLEQIGRDTEFDHAPDAAAKVGEIDDDLLRLVFTACHPVLSTEAQVALTLRMLGGLTTDEIARAFLVPEATMPSASAAPSSSSAAPASGSPCHLRRSGPAASRSCCTCSTWSSARATPPPQAQTSSVPTSPPRPSGWRGCCTSSSPPTARSRGCWR